MNHTPGGLWTATTFFNPLGWRRRTENYRSFRARIGTPLLTVEWHPSGHFILEDNDADLIIRVSGGDLLWQKERLLNIAFEHIPEAAEAIAWVDADVVFADPNWAERTMAMLDEHDVVQLFSDALFMPPDQDIPSRPEDARALYIHRGLVADIAQEESAAGRASYISRELADRKAKFEAPQDHPRRSVYSTAGLAWAATKHWLASVRGLPDRYIVGGGDTHMAYALLGYHRELADVHRRVGICRYHDPELGAWAKRASELGTRLGAMDGTLYHLYHGERADRQYGKRYFMMETVGFDASRHLEVHDTGVWRFSSQAPKPLRNALAEFFQARREDGPGAAPEAKLG